MPIYDFKCQKCGNIVEIQKPHSEKYVPECCKVPMKQVYSAPTLVAGKLNPANLPKG